MQPMHLSTRSIVAVLTTILLGFPMRCLAQYYAPSGYSLERWEEDYSSLKDPSARRDWYDAIKYVPLNDTGDIYLSFGGQARYRYDYFNNPTFGPGATNDEDGFHLQRYLVHTDAHIGEHFRTFVQVNSSFVDGRVGGGRYGDAQHFDLQQAFVDVSTSNDSNPYAYVRLGRQELIYGAQRYISPDDWRNVRRSFDGAKFSLSVPNDTIELFWVRPVLIERDQFDNDDGGTSFAGAYNALSLPDVIHGAGTKFETYFLALNQTRHSSLGADADTYTIGARFVTRPRPFDFDIEGNYQFGSFEGDSLSAWSLATEGGVTFESIMLTPRASVGFDIASGAPDPDGRFNQLFPPTYMYLGHLYLFGRPNIIDAHVGLDFHLTRDLTLFTAEHVFWRQNTDDGLYNLTGGVVRADNGSDASYVGNEFDIVLTWQINRYTSAYLGWAHFFPGDFIAETGPSQDVDFLYASVTFTF
jgi:hypothetical protein